LHLSILINYNKYLSANINVKPDIMATGKSVYNRLYGNKLNLIERVLLLNFSVNNMGSLPTLATLHKDCFPLIQLCYFR
jgi:hypothetical protein